MTSVKLEELERIEQRHKLGQRGWSGKFDQDYKVMCELHRDRAWLITALRDARGKALEEADKAVATGEYGESNGYVAAAINMATARIRALKEPT